MSSPIEHRKPYRPVVAEILSATRPRRILDAPSGDGWLKTLLEWDCVVDGYDLFAAHPPGYGAFARADLDLGIPGEPAVYDAVVCCEGIEHLTNPGLLLKSARRALVDGGTVVITTPNVWHPAARLAYLARGFFPSFPSLAERELEPGMHMHVIPWSFPQLQLHLRLAGFCEVRLHAVETAPKHSLERPIGALQKAYCARRRTRSANREEAAFWTFAGSDAAVFGRHLVVSAVARPTAVTA